MGIHRNRRADDDPAPDDWGNEDVGTDGFGVDVGKEEWFDAGWDGDDQPSRWTVGQRVRPLLIVLAVLGVVGAAVLAAAAFERSPQQAAPPAVEVATTVSTNTAVSTPGVVSAAPPDRADPGAATTAAAAATTAGATPVAATPATASSVAGATRASSRPEVAALQTVPALRDVIVVVNGKRYVTAADGTIDIAPADRHGTVEVIGLRADPPLVQATFSTWLDGVTDAQRPLDDVDGPVAMLGFSVAYRVQVAAGTAADGTVTFDSAGGPVQLTVGQPTFVTAARAAMGDGTMHVESLTYTARTLTRGPSSASINPVTFTPTPEALWRVVP